MMSPLSNTGKTIDMTERVVLLGSMLSFYLNFPQCDHNHLEKSPLEFLRTRFGPHHEHHNMIKHPFQPRVLNQSSDGIDHVAKTTAIFNHINSPMGCSRNDHHHTAEALIIYSTRSLNHIISIGSSELIQTKHQAALH